MYHVQARARSNSTKFSKTIVNLPEIKHVREYLKDEDIQMLPEKPYIFTHLKLSDGTIITQTVIVGSDKQELLVSPTELAKAFNLK